MYSSREIVKFSALESFENIQDTHFLQKKVNYTLKELKLLYTYEYLHHCQYLFLFT